MTQLDDLLKWYSALTPDNVKLAGDFYHPAVHFKDPFNDVQGVTALIAIFDHMFATTENPRFIMFDQFGNDEQAFVTWTFKFSLKGKPYSVQGSTHFKMDPSGLIIEHRDYWDAAEELFQQLPLIGGPIRWLRRQFKVNTTPSGH